LETVGGIGESIFCKQAAMSREIVARHLGVAVWSLYLNLQDWGQLIVRTMFKIPALLGVLTVLAAAEPPYSGTIFIDPDIITAADPTTYLSFKAAGRGNRTMFDRRVDAFIKVKARLFNVRFTDSSRVMEFQVNPEFGPTKARRLVAKYAKVIGRLPRCLRRDVDTVSIHDGVEPFGGGNRNLLIHTGQSASYERDGILEETMVHEASHTSLDADHANAKGWVAAQNADPEFISTYARDNPQREDVAETWLLWYAVRHRAERIDTIVADTVKAAIPNRLKYFDSRNFNLSPAE
jgi:hypothetical protein